MRIGMTGRAKEGPVLSGKTAMRESNLIVDSFTFGSSFCIKTEEHKSKMVRRPADRKLQNQIGYFIRNENLVVHPRRRKVYYDSEDS